MSELMKIIKSHASKSQVISSVTLDHHDNGYYFVRIHYRDTCSVRTMGFKDSELIQAIGTFLQCDQYIGRTDDEYMKRETIDFIAEYERKYK